MPQGTKDDEPVDGDEVQAAGPVDELEQLIAGLLEDCAPVLKPFAAAAALEQPACAALETGSSTSAAAPPPEGVAVAAVESPEAPADAIPIAEPCAQPNPKSWPSPPPTASHSPS